MGHDVVEVELFECWWCSRAWLESRVSKPNEGCTDEEAEARREWARWQSHEFVDQLLPKDLLLIQGDPAEERPVDVPAEAGEGNNAAAGHDVERREGEN